MWHIRLSLFLHHPSMMKYTLITFIEFQAIRCRDMAQDRRNVAKGERIFYQFNSKPILLMKMFLCVLYLAMMFQTLRKFHKIPYICWRDIAPDGRENRRKD